MNRFILVVLLLLAVSFNQLLAVPAGISSTNQISLEFNTTDVNATAFVRSGLPSEELRQQPGYLAQLLRSSLLQGFMKAFEKILYKVSRGEWEEGDNIIVDGEPVYPATPCATQEECRAKARVRETEVMQKILDAAGGKVAEPIESDSREMNDEGSGTTIPDGELPSSVITTPDINLPFKEEDKSSADEDVTPIIAIVPPEQPIDEKFPIEGSGVEEPEQTIDIYSYSTPNPPKLAVQPGKPSLEEEWKHYIMPWSVARPVVGSAEEMMNVEKTTKEEVTGGSEQ